MAFGNRGTLSPLGSLMQINNAFAEEVSSVTDTTGHIIVSYVNYSPAGAAFIDYLRLNITNNTAVINLAGGNNCLCDIQEGMWIDAVFSRRMTRSIPPQAHAFVVLARRELPVSSDTTAARIISIDEANSSILTGSPGNRNSQTRFIITDHTIIRNRLGLPIGFSNLRPGQRVRIVHANFRTASIPPQTTAFYIQLV